METRKAATSEIKQSSEANRDLEEMLLEILHSDYSFSLAQQQQNHSTSVVNNLAYDDSLPSVDLLVGRSREPCNEELFKSIPADSLVLTEKIPTMSLPYQFLKSNSDPGPLMCDQEQSETEENCAENSSESLVQCKRLDVSAPKQYWCSVPGCGGQFTRRNNLKTHMRLHNNENPFIVTLDAGDHLNGRVHSNTIIGRISDRPYETLRKKKKWQEENLLEHLQSVLNFHSSLRVRIIIQKVHRSESV
eukprot:CAMPEP_0182442728 /NCGR_PEP_ID=MMETSP1172-20130603/1626_1 /TAXON_ID=708627 /ORGANISM="Timspurckia oligopyrenoides, Strain CCMP3278" /LENGTH=246 /DNA_ID=CAMNT_0024637745 /DNA_START=140 /DNA_END=881 /DNA_ORIENTATION=+